MRYASAMTGYNVLRLVHGYWRWAVLASALVLLVRAFAGARAGRDWSAGDDRASRWFVASADVQLLLGLILYFAFSPFWSALHGSFHAAMKDPVTRFFAIEHETAMVIAVAIAHVGRVRIRRAPDAASKRRAAIAWTLVFLAILLWAVPWPWRATGRPLFRGSL
jgi:hypothetical protein